MPIPLPKEWPNEVLTVYEPIRELGRGGFASVILARSKVDKELNVQHAIKVIGSNEATKQELAYALREIDILQELDHPNIVRIFHHWEPAPDAHLCAAVIALSYASGPTLDKLLQIGGRLSIVCARVISAQLIDAVYYLHGRAVVHRDIKPDNIIVSGATLDQDEIWDELDELDQEWRILRQKWHITIIDFGFARALTPDDMSKAPPSLKKKSTANQKSNLDSSTRSLSNSISKSIGKSISRRFNRRMSAVGNRTYAAPEIVNGVIRESSAHNNNSIVNSSRHPIDVTRTLSEHVSYYGLLADAYSVGNTMKYMLTGVSPDQNVDDVLALENNPFVLIGKIICGICSTSKEKQQRKVQYRKWSSIPKEALRLVRGLTHKDSRERMSIRSARLHPWIDDILDDVPNQNNNGQEPDFLSFTLKEAPLPKAIGTGGSA